ncbi:MAG: hypothetical protein JW811_01060 [Clostridiales bacterium]|nr:hypothetical protein [Clostridiales bacterium]
MKKQYDDDDGRVIASMDVADLRPRRTPRRRVKANELRPSTDVTKREAWHVAYNATLAALFIGGVIMGVIALVVLILTLVW